MRNGILSSKKLDSTMENWDSMIPNWELSMKNGEFLIKTRDLTMGNGDLVYLTIGNRDLNQQEWS